MPTKPKHPCSFPGCSELTNSRYCDKHKRQEQQRQDERRGTSASRGYNARWQKIRIMVLKEEPLCRECMRRGILKPATDVHHIDGNVMNMDRSNLEPLCHECHSRKTVAENGRWG